VTARTSLEDLIALSHELGREERDLAILGEGNTSADCGDGTFWIKASGYQLRDIDASGFSRVDLRVVLTVLEEHPPADRPDDVRVRDGLRGALTDARHALPSVETFLHAVCLTEGGARWVAHTHPVSVNSILCSRAGAEPFLQHLFPDGIVVCGRRPAVIPYTDPGIPLALAARTELRRFREQHGETPKTLLIENHGLVALGQTVREALNITFMADKWARILQGTYRFGGPRPLSEDDVERIDSRPDEHYRRRRLTGDQSASDRGGRQGEAK
jgi:rhamnose utilization protein RhaD (predicted bifunctional aldolase and dehydrogenase)